MMININHHVYFHGSPDTSVLAALARIEATLQLIITKENNMSAALDALEAEVAANAAVDQSAITLLNGLAAQILSLKNDPAKLADLAASLKASSADLAAAVVANTPAA